MSPLQNVPITCPNCRTRFFAQTTAVIDAAHDPEAKAMLLAGELNVAVCPQCGHAGMLATPLLYHDADKELLFTFVPSEMGASELEQQRMFGDATGRIIASLPAEQRKAYLLQPRSFLRLEAMLEAILEADGITPEMLAVQRARVSLLERLLRTPAEESRRSIAQENDNEIDYGFFELVSVNIEMAQGSKQLQALQQLIGLRSELMRWTTAGRELADREEAIESLGEGITREALLEKLVEAGLAEKRIKVETMVAMARPVIDYMFYQQLSELIGALEQQGKAENARRLRELRQAILQQTAEIDAQVQKETEEAAQFLRLVASSEDPDSILRANADRVDELFLNMLMANLQAAEREGQSNLSARLVRVRDAVMRLIQESQPPEIQFVNQLLSEDYPEATRTALEARRGDLDDRLFSIMAAIRENLVHQGQDQAAQRLAEIEAQAKLIRAGL
ncbi:MAG TPA: CpXC domain-containing protein [Anaerolineae bacterium]|nr:CpXC domain-containing protein [Anaerolineae bacterium]